MTRPKPQIELPAKPEASDSTAKASRLTNHSRGFSARTLSGNFLNQLQSRQQS